MIQSFLDNYAFNKKVLKDEETFSTQLLQDFKIFVKDNHKVSPSIIPNILVKFAKLVLLTAFVRAHPKALIDVPQECLIFLFFIMSLENNQQDFNLQEENHLVGKVSSMKDGVVSITIGLISLLVNSYKLLVQFLNKSKNSFGMALNLETDQASIHLYCMILSILSYWLLTTIISTIKGISHSIRFFNGPLVQNGVTYTFKTIDLSHIYPCILLLSTLLWSINPENSVEFAMLTTIMRRSAKKVADNSALSGSKGTTTNTATSPNVVVQPYATHNVRDHDKNSPDPQAGINNPTVGGSNHPEVQQGICSLSDCKNKDCGPLKPGSTIAPCNETIVNTKGIAHLTKGSPSVTQGKVVSVDSKVTAIGKPVPQNAVVYNQTHTTGITKEALATKGSTFGKGTDYLNDKQFPDRLANILKDSTT